MKLFNLVYKIKNPKTEKSFEVDRLKIKKVARGRQWCGIFLTTDEQLQ